MYWKCADCFMFGGLLLAWSWKGTILITTRHEFYDKGSRMQVKRSYLYVLYYLWSHLPPLFFGRLEKKKGNSSTLPAIGDWTRCLGHWGHVTHLVQRIDAVDSLIWINSGWIWMYWIYLNCFIDMASCYYIPNSLFFYLWFYYCLSYCMHFIYLVLYYT